jgi:hypothetical protein
MNRIAERFFGADKNFLKNPQKNLHISKNIIFFAAEKLSKHYEKPYGI